MPFGVREGINIFLAGFIPTENLRFREIGLTFKVAENVDENLDQQKHHCMNSYGDMTKTMQRAGSDSKFILRLQKGSFNDSEIVVLLGENGTGKTTFIRLLAGLIQADDGARVPFCIATLIIIETGVDSKIHEHETGIQRKMQQRD